MTIDILLESLKKAVDAICPEAVETLYNMQTDMKFDARFNQADVDVSLRDAMCYKLITKISDIWPMATDSLCELIRQHRNSQHGIRPYFLVYRLFFDNCIPKIEYVRCCNGVLSQSELSNGYLYTAVELDSQKDEIEIPKEYRVFSAELCGSDWTHIAETFFKNKVWPQIKSFNLENAVCSPNDLDDYDEDYL